MTPAPWTPDIARIHNATNGRVSYEDFVRSELASEAAE